jgi:hypothetical protein
MCKHVEFFNKKISSGQILTITLEASTSCRRAQYIARFRQPLPVIQPLGHYPQRQRLRLG